MVDKVHARLEHECARHARRPFSKWLPLRRAPSQDQELVHGEWDFRESHAIHAPLDGAPSVGHGHLPTRSKGNTDHLTMKGNTAHLTMKGNTAHLTMKGNTAHLTMKGNTAHLTMKGNTAHLTMKGNTGHLTMKGNTGHLTMKGNTVHFLT